MNQVFSINITALPLLFIPILIVLLMGFSVLFYIKTNKRESMLLFVVLLVFCILSFFPYNTAKHTTELRFLSEYYLYSVIAVIGVVISVQMYLFLNKNEWLHRSIDILLLLLCVGTFAFNGLITIMILNLAFIVYGVLYFRNAYMNGESFWLNSTYFTIAILGLLGILGSIFLKTSILFLFSFVLVVLCFLQIFRFFDYVTRLLKSASLHSMTDPLTGLYNKGFLLQKVAQLARSQELSIIFADIDNFKELNDTKGHDVGDRVLIEVGQILKDVIGNHGYPCRFGGEEIVGVVFQKDAKKLAERFRTLVEKKTEVTVSVGVASGTGDGNGIIKLADERMYSAKKSGKNKVVTS